MVLYSLVSDLRGFYRWPGQLSLRSLAEPLLLLLAYVGQSFFFTLIHITFLSFPSLTVCLLLLFTLFLFYAVHLCVDYGVFLYGLAS